MNEFNEREIALAKQLHALLAAKGELPEMRKGDWFIIQNPAEPARPVCQICKSIEDAEEINSYRSDIILLPSWKRCRELLGERGWVYQKTIHKPDKTIILISKNNFIDTSTFSQKRTHSSTDLEAILAVLVAVEEER